MEKKIKHYLNFLILLFFILFFTSKSLAIENKKFLTLKNDEVNLRQGPSFEYPIKLIYKKKNLPVLILDKSETWRKITDFENNTGWLHISSALNKKCLALFMDRGIQGMFLVIVCAILTVKLYYFPGLIFAALHILC